MKDPVTLSTNNIQPPEYREMDILCKKQHLPRHQTIPFGFRILKRLKSIALEYDTNKRCMEAAGALDYLASLLTNRNENEPWEAEEGNRASDAAINILYHLKLFEASFKSLIAKNAKFISSLMRVMQGGNYESCY
ncbi:hypothetical protein RJ639_011886 [Escallonia herrerae]|uniref:U-box domain-containing protein n=1 Tax=Escallonia herrerae TaxID=1293975 RepID=A0AA88VMJ9_9ASTE|nr:hypothetical protein RJ639_011886 [Escallonia herrerae]